MKIPLKCKSGFLTALLLAACAVSVAGKDPFSLTARDVGKSGGAAEASYIDDGYAWGFANLGFMLNGHGLPDHRRTFVITHTAAPKVERGDDRAAPKLVARRELYLK